MATERESGKEREGGDRYCSASVLFQRLPLLKIQPPGSRKFELFGRVGGQGRLPVAKTSQGPALAGAFGPGIGPNRCRRAVAPVSYRLRTPKVNAPIDGGGAGVQLLGGDPERMRLDVPYSKTVAMLLMWRGWC